MEDVIENIKEHMGLQDSDIKLISRNRIAILTDENRIEAIRRLEEHLSSHGWKYTNKSTISSIGCLQLNEKIIAVKPRSAQNEYVDAISNEHTFVYAIHRGLIASKGLPLNITFVDDRLKKKTYKNIVSCTHVGSSNTQRKKADVALIDQNGKIYPISIKMGSGDRWESADTYWGDKARDYIKRLAKTKKIKLQIQDNDTYKITPNFAVKATRIEAKDVVFGADIIEGNGFVVIENFTDDDFKQDGTKLTIRVDKVIDTIDDLDKSDYPWFIVRNDSSRASAKIGYPGIRVTAVRANRLYNTVLKVNRNEL